MLLGIDPEREALVSRILTGLTEGRLPSPGANELLLGSEMARQLEVAPGGEVVVVAPAADGSMGNDLFVVSGIFRTGLSEVDLSHALLPLDSLQRLVALEPSRVHEIAIRLGWDRVHKGLRLSKPFYDRFTPAIASSDFALREGDLDRALDFLAVCRV